MNNPITVLRSLSAAERLKAALLSSWFFLVITTLWLLKPIRSASLLAHLGSAEIPYVRLGSVIALAIIVAGYSAIVNRFTRLGVARGASLLFAAMLVAFWLALQLGGDALGAKRWFVWAIFILVDVYSTVMVGIFWTYTNDVMTRAEADKLYGPIGVGGIVGGIAGGVLVDVLVHPIGQVNLLLVCVGFGLVCAAIVTHIERRLRPSARPRRDEADTPAGGMFEGVRDVLKNRYLLLIVGIVVGYEFVAAMTDFVVSVIFERNIPGKDDLAQMFGRLGWIVSITALAAQVFVVPALLPSKRVALLVPPLAMALGMLGVAILPLVSLAVFLSAADRGLNYSLQQVTKETLYVPLDDAQKYKAKAFIDMFVDRAGKALSALALIAVIAVAGISVLASLAVAFVALVVWGVSAYFLGRAYAEKVGGDQAARTPARGGAEATELPPVRADVTQELPPHGAR
jgi:ATP:ADP antiporter, AAA family